MPSLETISKHSQPHGPHILPSQSASPKKTIKSSQPRTCSSHIYPPMSPPPPPHPCSQRHMPGATATDTRSPAPQCRSWLIPRAQPRQQVVNGRPFASQPGGGATRRTPLLPGFRGAWWGAQVPWWGASRRPPRGLSIAPSLEVRCQLTVNHHWWKPTSAFFAPTSSKGLNKRLILHVLFKACLYAATAYPRVKGNVQFGIGGFLWKGNLET